MAPASTICGRSSAMRGIVPFDRQDSSLMSILSTANALLVRAPDAPAATAGETVDYIAL